MKISFILLLLYGVYGAELPKMEDTVCVFIESSVPHLETHSEAPDVVVTLPFLSAADNDISLLKGNEPPFLSVKAGKENHHYVLPDWVRLDSIKALRKLKVFLVGNDGEFYKAKLEMTQVNDTAAFLHYGDKFWKIRGTSAASWTRLILGKVWSLIVFVWWKVYTLIYGVVIDVALSPLEWPFAVVVGGLLTLHYFYLFQLGEFGLALAIHTVIFKIDVIIGLLFKALLWLIIETVKRGGSASLSLASFLGGKLFGS